MEQSSDNKLVLTTLVACLGGFLFGFDMAVVSGVLPLVQKQFDLSSFQEGWFVSSALVGCIIGVIFSSGLSDRFGRKQTLFLSAAFFLLAAIGCTFLPDFTLLIIARIAGGLAVGITSSVVPLYLSEIAPDNKRGRLVTFYQLAITIGIFSAYLSNSLLQKYTVDAWRLMFGVGVLPAVLFLLGLTLIPESPRWLIKKSIITDTGVEQPNKSATAEDTSYKQLFSPALRRALLIGILLPLFSQFSGINAIIYYGPTILLKAGITLSNSLLSQLFFGAANVLFTLIAIWKVDSLGRRPLYLWGTAGATISLILTGICFYTGATSGILLLLCVLSFLAFFAFSIGPLKFVIAAEIFPDGIRAKALSLSIMVMWVADAIVGQLTPMLLHSLGIAQTFWFFALFCLLAFIAVYKLLPETKGKSLEQIQSHWKNLVH